MIECQECGRRPHATGEPCCKACYCGNLEFNAAGLHMKQSQINQLQNALIKYYGYGFPGLNATIALVQRDG